MTAIVGVGPGEATHARLKNWQIFGAYRIERLVGQGGMGEVYEAEQLEHGRRLALKVVNGRLADPADRSRFHREGELAASVNHPNSVYIFGARGDRGVARHLDGTAGRRYVEGLCRKRMPLPPAEAADAILQVIALDRGAISTDILEFRAQVFVTQAARGRGPTESGADRGT